MWENAAESMCICMCFSVLLSGAQQAEKAACMCLEPQGSVVCGVSGKQQLHRLGCAGGEVCGDEAGMVGGSGSEGHWQVRAGRHSWDRHTPAVYLGQALWARDEKLLPSEGEHEGPG